MKVLEARFFPLSKSLGPPVAIAEVVCDGPEATVRPLDIAKVGVGPFKGEALMTRLKLLIGSSVSDPYEGLTGLRSEYWSFVEVNPDRSRSP